MASRSFSLEPKKVPPVKTPFRVINTPLPAPESLPIIEALRHYEPMSMRGQPPILWDTAEGCIVKDRWGNQWLDWSSGVLVANAGHGRKEIVDAIVKQAQAPLLHNYCFPNQARADLVKYLVEIAPPEIDKCFLLTTGAESTECAIKLAKTHGIKVGGERKDVIVSFDHGFHGRTLGSQLAGGIPGLKNWITRDHSDFVQVPFPDDWRLTPDRKTFSGFEKALKQKCIEPDQIAGVICETYQGGTAALMPPAFSQELRRWCTAHKIVLILDEVQAGFGRCGTLFGFELIGIVPDLITCGKGISSSLPLSAVLGKSSILDLYPPGSMTSTHTGNPVCAAAALANLKLIVEGGLIENAAARGREMHRGLEKIVLKYRERIGKYKGNGLVWALQCVKPGTTEADPDLAFRVVERCIEKGLMLFAPVGFMGASIKICPPLCITAEQLADGLAALNEAFDEVVPELVEE